MLSGYTIGVAYIQSCTPKDIAKVKSLYLLVRAEISTPKPKLINATCNNKRGINNNEKFKRISKP